MNMESPHNVVVEARGLVRNLGTSVTTPVLRGIDLAVREREFVSLTGQSGSGKSTLLYLLGALDVPTAGHILIDGVDVGTLGDDERAAMRSNKIGFVFQFHFLLPEFTVLENVLIPMYRRAHHSRAECMERAHTMLGRLGLEKLAQRRPHQLSGGEQQRVSIARAVAVAPRLVLADEPTGNLDSKNALGVMETFERLIDEEGLTVVMVTHANALAARATRRVTMRDGVVIEERTLGR